MSVNAVGKAYTFKSLANDDVVIGDAADVDFHPKFTLNRWNGECWLKLLFDDSAIAKAQRNVSLAANKVIWDTPLFTLRFYPLTQTVEHEDGGLELEVILKSKSPKNSYTFPLQKQSIKLYYQPPLNQELNPADYDILTETEAWKDGKLRCYRPPEIVGSYAVYHESKVNGKYKAGKILHLPRPKLTDADGKTAWGSYNPDADQTGQLIITLPQDFLDTAKYPVTVDPTFGYTSIGASNTGNTIGFWNSKFACKFQALESGTITDITFYGSGAGATIGGYLCDYSDNADVPNALLGSGALTIPANPAWTTVSGLSIAITSGSQHWLTVNWGQNDQYIIYYYDVGDANQHAIQGSGSDTPPPNASFGSVTTYSARKMSIYATYTTGGTLQTVTDSVGLSDSILRHKTLLPITDVLGLTDAVLRNKTLTIADSVGASDIARSDKFPLIVADAVSLVDLINVITGAIIKTVADVIGVSDMALINKTAIIADVVGVLDQVFRHKPAVSVADVVSTVETALAFKLLAITDSVSLTDVLKVLKTLNVSDTLSLVDAVSTPSRVLRALDSVGLADNAFVNKILQVTDTVSLVEVVTVGVAGAKKTKLFLVLGDLAIQLSGD